MASKNKPQTKVIMPEAVEIEPVFDSTIEPEYKLSDLTSSYNSIKRNATEATKKLNSITPIGDLAEVQEIVASGLHEMDQFVQQTSKKSTNSVSKALAAIPWAGAWFDKAKDKQEEEDFKSRTMDEIADTVITQISEQRETVVKYMTSVVDIRQELEQHRGTYQDLLEKASTLLPTVTPDTREELDTKALVTRLNKTLIQLDSTLRNDITTLLGSAKIAIQEIDSQLPDIEYDLKHNMSLATAQQALANLMGMTKSVKKMTEVAGDMIKDNIEATTIESIELAGEIMLDSDRIKKLHDRETKHMANVYSKMEETKAKINKNFEDTQTLRLEYAEKKEEYQHALLDVKSSIE